MPSNLPTDKGVLYVVATPIGNKEDITLRALKVLGNVDLIAAEDTRKTGIFLAFHKINNHLISYHEYNEHRRTPDLINRLNLGKSIALVSNAGTPTISDPGYRLITKAISNSIQVVPIPGVSAVATAISASGLFSDSFVFIGFLPKKKGRRLKELTELSTERRTIVFYESPKRVITLLEEINQIMGDRYSVLSREMTKIHEEFIRGQVSQIAVELKRRSVVKGECTLLVSGFKDDEKISSEDLAYELKDKIEKKDAKLSNIAKEISEKYRLQKSRVYDLALKIKDEQN